MLRGEMDALACKAAREALDESIPDELVEYAVYSNAHQMTEALVELLAAKAAKFEKAPRRGRSLLADEITLLKIVLAVRAAVPGIGIVDEIEIRSRRWPTRESPTLTVSLDCLANILKDELAEIDPKKLAGLMASLCRYADGEIYLAESEAVRYEKEAGIYEPDEDDEVIPEIPRKPRIRPSGDKANTETDNTVGCDCAE